MSDARRRGARRAVERTGTLEDKARLLRERVRAGELTDAQLQVAALLDVEGAAAALGVEPSTLPDTCERLRAWAADIALVGRRPRALVVGALSALLLREDTSVPESNHPDDPDHALLQAVCRHAEDDRAVSRDDVEGLAAQVAALAHPEDGPGLGVEAVRALRSRRAFDDLVDTVIGDEREAGPIVQAIRDAALPWCTGEAGPRARAPGSIRPYSPTTRFSRGERIGHPRFGEGEVVSADARRITVRFGAEERQLVHGARGAT